jgi:L-fuculose-phosphate aldolase
MSDQDLRRQMADYARRLHARGWVANHDGNISARLPGGRFLCTPTATSKAEVTADGLVVVDEAGAKVGGKGRPFSEIGLHLAVYRSRPDVQAVIHAHPVTATGFAVAGCALDVPFIAEAVVSVGPGIPLVPVAAPGPAAAQALAPFAGTYDVVLLGGHGVMAWGDDIEQAYLRVELCEHLARIALVARQLGGVRPLPAAMLPALLEARQKAGLGPQARGHAPAAAAVAAPAGDLTTIIREEIAAALRR